MKRKRSDYVFTAIFAAIMLTIGVAVYLEWRACRAVDGQFVRGLFWFECIR